MTYVVTECFDSSSVPIYVSEDRSLCKIFITLCEDLKIHIITRVGTETFHNYLDNKDRASYEAFTKEWDKIQSEIYTEYGFYLPEGFLESHYYLHAVEESKYPLLVGKVL